jgi:Zn-dependent peptidase ImmA (M78 family)
MRWLQHISLALQNRLDLPTVDVPAPVKSNEYAKLSDADLESIAISVRHHWGLGEGPITQMALLAENAGVIIGIDEVGSTKIDGQANWSSVDSRPYILLARDKYTAYRRQMDIGHELAHLILHRDVSGTQLVNDFELIEHQAKYFAGAFLLPARSFVAEIPSLSLEGFKSLKRKWMVAIGAMIMRAEQLCVLTEEGARRLWKYKAARGWAQKEPFDDPTETPVEEPRLLRRAIELVTAHNVRARRDLLETDLGIGAGDVELLASLQRGFFAEASGQVVRLEPKLRLVVESQGGDIVPFKRS